MIPGRKMLSKLYRNMVSSRSPAMPGEAQTADTGYKYNTSDDGLAEDFKNFTSRHGDGSGDSEEDFLSCLKLVACCKQGGTFLDIGSGFGRIVEIIRPYARHVVALEPDAERFRYCRDIHAGRPNIEVHRAVSAGYRAENPGRTFDVITFSMVMQHVSTRQAQDILQNISTLLAPDGLAVIGTTHFFDERFVYETRHVPVSAGEFDLYAADIAHQEWGIPVRLFSKESFLAALADASLEVVLWKQFCYVRPEAVKTFAGRYEVPADAIRDTGTSQFAVVRKASRSGPSS